ncbi:MAG TPA: hypothetical protein VLK85_34565 [Ramlibacter sp.]|nr:hypothetical protein [Ramlibacter sp.]
MHPQQLQQWRDSATQGLTQLQEQGATPQQTKQERRRIQELERQMRRKEKALAEAIALYPAPGADRIAWEANKVGEGCTG